MENIYYSKYGYKTIEKPLLNDAITLLSDKKNAIKFSNLFRFKKFLDKQVYFSASYSHCFQSIEDYNNNIIDNNSIMLFETGHELKAVWNDNTNTGYILP